MPDDPLPAEGTEAVIICLLHCLSFNFAIKVVSNYTILHEWQIEEGH